MGKGEDEGGQKNPGVRQYSFVPNEFFLLTVFLLLTTCLAAPAAALIGLPGSTWGELTRDGNNFEGWGSQGYVSQGIDWVKIGENRLDTYLSGTWRYRSNNTLYYDAFAPALGIEAQGSFYHVGVELSRTQYSALGTATSRMQLQAGWYKDWTLASNSDTHEFMGIHVKDLPGYTWGILTHTFDRLEGTGSQGFVDQGVTWFILPHNVAVNTFLEYRWRMREFNITYYNVYGPAIGLEFRRSPFRAGVEYYWESIETGPINKKLDFFFSWYYSWDLHKS